MNAPVGARGAALASGDRGRSHLGSVAALTALSENPCDLLSAEELAEATGVEISGATRVLGQRESFEAAKDPDRNKVATLAADASRRAALLVAYILPVCALLALPGGRLDAQVGNLFPTRVLN